MSKLILAGENVTVLNAEKIMISGSKDWAYKKYKQRIDRASISNPRDMGPKYPRRPDDIFRRTVRGMIPYKKSHGRKLSRLLKYMWEFQRNLKHRKHQEYLKQNQRISQEV